MSFQSQLDSNTKFKAVQTATAAGAAQNRPSERTQAALRALAPGLRSGAEVMAAQAAQAGQAKAAPAPQAAPAQPQPEKYAMSRKQMEEMLMLLAERVLGSEERLAKAEARVRRVERAFDDLAQLHVNHAEQIARLRREIREGGEGYEGEGYEG